MTHLNIIENLLYGAMDSSNELLDEIMLLTACGKIEPKEGETYEETLARTCDEIREECRTMWESIAFYHDSIYLGSKVQGLEEVYEEL